MFMKHLLSSSAFLVVNKWLAKQIGLKETILLADLISKEEYFISNGMSEGWFFNTEDNIQQDTTLTSTQQRKCIKNLVKLNILEVKRKGIPAKRYFKINEEQVINFLKNLSLSKDITINKNKEIKNKDIYIFKRQKEFESKVSLLDFDTQIKIQFCDYWTEMNKSKTKMKFELEKTFDIKKRMLRWKKNSEKWDKPKGMSKIDVQLNEYLKGKEYL